MMEHRIALNSLPSAGLSLTVDDLPVWTAPLREFDVACTVLSPFKAEVFLLRQDGGCFVRGRLTGEVSLPCDRCAEAFRTTIDQPFETFEPAPRGGSPDAEPDAEPDADADENVMRLGESGPEINLAALLWEEFSLSLPIHPLCRFDCAGLCPVCGRNLNEGACVCNLGQGDPRLAALRGLTIKKSSPASE
jgi:uncharacterized protein